MRRLDLARRDAGLRARRWDVIVLGGALPGLVAATRLGQRGYRVLVVEEEAAARLPAPLRDPFFLGPPGSAGIVDAVLAALKIGLRDRRRIEPDPVSYQVVTRTMRLDVGGTERTAQELVAWGLAKPEPAREGMAALARAADGELAGLLEAPLLRRSAGLRGLGRGRPATTPETRRAPLSDLAVLGDPGLAHFFDAQLEVLANVSPGPLPLTAKARLLGAPLQGGGGLPSADVTLRRLLRRRLEELHGEVRTVRDFELVSVDPHPGVALPSRREVWVGRVLVLNAPLGLLAAALREAEQPVADFLEAPAARRRRIAVDLRCDPRVIPEGMSRRVIRPLDPGPDGETRTLSIARWPGAAAHDAVQLVGCIAVDPSRTTVEQAQRTATDAILELIPFSEGRILQREHSLPRWDDEGALGAAEAGGGWPPEATLRLGSRRPVYALPREATGALGTEGDALLGLRAGDAIAEDLG